MQLQTRKEVIVQRIGDDVIALNLNTEKYYRLNDVGGRILEICKKPTPIEELADKISIEYDVDRDKVELDVREIMPSLVAEGLAELI
jgi:hypothetical protein